MRRRLVAVLTAIMLFSGLTLTMGVSAMQVEENPYAGDYDTWEPDEIVDCSCALQSCTDCGTGELPEPTLDQLPQITVEIVETTGGMAMIRARGEALWWAEE